MQGLSLIKTSFRRLSYAKTPRFLLFPNYFQVPTTGGVGCPALRCATGEGEGLLWNVWRNSKGSASCRQDQHSATELALKQNIRN